MSAQANHTVWSAFLSPTSDTVAVGSCMIPNANTKYYIIASAANRTAAARTSRASGLAITAGDSVNRHIEIQTVGPCPPSLTGLTAGTASDLRVSSTGRLERATISGSDIYAGRCDADGWAYLDFAGNPSSVGGSFTAGGDLSGDDTTQTVESIQGVVITGTPAAGNVLRATAADAASWGELDLADADATTGVLPVANGGTGLSAVGTANQVLATNAGATGLEWQTVASGGAPTDAQYVTLATNGTLSNERVLTAGTGISLTDGGAGGDITVTNTAPATAITGSDTYVMFFDGANNPAGDSGMVFNKTTNVLSLGGAFAQGSAPSSTGGVRLANNSFVATRNSTNAADINLIGATSSDNIDIGQLTGAHVGNVHINNTTTQRTVFQDNSIYRAFIDTDQINLGLPVGGLAEQSVPFRFKVASVDCTGAGATITPTAAQYECPIHYLTGTPSAPFNYVLPSTDGAVFNIRNDLTEQATVLGAGGGSSVPLGSTSYAERRWVSCKSPGYELMEFQA